MASSNGVGGRGNGDRAQDLKTNGDSGSEPVEISVRGRIVIRLSSHPPGAGASPVDDATGVQWVDAPTASEASEPRSQKLTPAERPRRRRQVQAAMRALQLAGESSGPSATSVPLGDAVAVSTLAVADVTHAQPQDYAPPPIAHAVAAQPGKLSLVLMLGITVALAIVWALLGR